MAFPQFTFPAVIEELGLLLADANLFAAVKPLVVRPEFAAALADGANLAAAINTEKARSEFAVAPLLLELRRLWPGRFGLFSGVELVADANRGLNGFCGFLLTRSPSQHVITAPILAVVEAKNDNLRTGLGQCIATMVAARLINTSADVVYGAVTTGSLWRFLSLTETDLIIDYVEYHINAPDKLLAILSHIVS